MKQKRKILLLLMGLVVFVYMMPKQSHQVVDSVKGFIGNFISVKVK